MHILLRVGIWTLIGALSCTLPASAQRIKKDALEKARWYTTPREVQIIDERPVVRDFRSSGQPQGGDDGGVDLPPPPKGMSASGGGSGAMGSAGSSLPDGGLQLGGPNQGYKTDSSGLSNLPSAGFNGASANLPKSGFAVPSSLPSTRQGMLRNANWGQGQGKAQPSAIANNGARRAMPTPNRGPSSGSYKGPAVQSYSGGYGSGSGSAYGGSASQSTTAVRGYLLNKHSPQ